MEDNDNKTNEFKADKIEDVLRERERIEKIIQTKFQKRMAILFSDVCGYTQFMDTRGDIAGRAWIQKHHDMVLPLVEDNEGKVLAIMGDGVMAAFPSSHMAVKASVAIQKKLSDYNKTSGSADQIHVSMGINVGDILVDKDDIAGDVVNVASRIESKAEKDQILISKPVYEDVCGSDDILCRLHGSVSVKGKAVPLDLFRVAWQDEDIVISAEPRVRGRQAVAEKKKTASLKMLQLEITREGDRLKISASEQSAGQVSTVRHYEETPVSIKKIEERCREIVNMLNNANRKGRLTREVLVKLRETGQVFRDELFTLNVKKKIRESQAEHLILNLDDQLVHVPWELLHDGKQFLCQRFSMGRLVRTRQAILGDKIRHLAPPLKMLILADPEGDLKGAYQEGTQLRDQIDKNRALISASMRAEGITPDFLREKIRNFDFVHFAGHADYDQENPAESGWRLSKGVLKAGHIIKMAGTAAMPTLIFSNACQSARTEDWTIQENFQNEIFGLANAFILAGVKHYVGTFWEILDDPSRRFALEFYKHLLAGWTMGEAMREARLALIKEYGEETIVWASYLLYGDPTTNYMDQVRESEPVDEPEPVRAVAAGGEVRGHEEVIDFAEKREAPKGKKIWLGLAAGIVALLAVILFVYPGVLTTGTEKYEKAALAYYADGNYDEALKICATLEDKNPKACLAYLLKGNIFLRSGKLDQAEAAYGKAVNAKKGSESQKAEAYIGMGRIASLREQPEGALKYYRQATRLAPTNRAGYLSQAVLLEQNGNFDDALNLLGKAQSITPNDQVIAAYANETRKKMALTRDKDKQARIDKLVKDLLKTLESPERALPSDGWTSSPLTVWLMDLTTRGYALQEGHDRLLLSGITDQLIQNSHAQVVERALLDKLLEELKIGTSKLADRSTALSLGKLLAARLILSGQLIHSGPQTQVSLRLIETETGRISGSMTGTFTTGTSASDMSGKISNMLLEKLGKLYPIRGKVTGVNQSEVTLNIGSRAGVKEGQRYQVVNEDVVLEILSIQADGSLAKVVEGKKPLKAGLRVQAM